MQISTLSFKSSSNLAVLDFESGQLSDYLKDTTEFRNYLLDVSIADDGHSHDGIISTRSLKFTHTNPDASPDLM